MNMPVRDIDKVAWHAKISVLTLKDHALGCDYVQSRYFVGLTSYSPNVNKEVIDCKYRSVAIVDNFILAMISQPKT